jgi:type IV secretion system protein VirB4
VTNFGLIDQAKGAYALVPQLKAADLDLVFCDMVTYATSATFGIIIRSLDIPIVLVALQPLARIDEPDERAWAAEWIAGVLTREGVTVDPVAKDLVWSALSSLASAPVHERTLTGLAVLLQSQALKRALEPYTLAGPWGRLMDAEAERLGEADVQAFETEGLIGTAAAPAVLAYLFHAIGRRLDGRPTLLIVDEGWLALDDATFGAQLKEWLKTRRKKNASVIFATQSRRFASSIGLA